MFGYNRKDVMKGIHALIQRKYGTYNELVNMTLLELSEIEKVIISMEQQETLARAGLS